MTEVNGFNERLCLGFEYARELFRTPLSLLYQSIDCFSDRH